MYDKIVKVGIHLETVSDSGIGTPKSHIQYLRKRLNKEVIEKVKSGVYNGIIKTKVKLGQDIVPEEDPVEGLSYTTYWSVQEKDEIDLRKETK